MYVVEVTTGFNSNSKQSDIELRMILNDDFLIHLVLLDFIL